MSDREEVQALLKSRERIERRINRLMAELKHLQFLLKLIDERIAAASFKPAEALVAKAAPEAPPAQPPAPPSQAQLGEAYPLKASDGTLLATLYVKGDELRLVPSEELKFNVNTPPFQQFLIAKVLNRMAAKDKDDAAAGRIGPDEIFTYKVVQEGGVIREVIVRNVREERRMATLKNAFRWTLEKMYEKTRGSG